MSIKTFFKWHLIPTMLLFISSIEVAKGQEQKFINHYYVIESERDNPYSELIIKSLADENSFTFALKSNLLFDALTMINFEIEVPIRDQWSVAGEFIFPWWIMDNHRASSKRNRLQLLNGNLEGRYWWGDRSTQPQLTGWFSGLYTGIGSYDIEYDKKGHQGEFFIAAGVSGGYAHTINSRGNLRMEYSLGLGYLATDYRYYEAEFCDYDRWHAVEKRRGRYSWFGPTRAKVSLSWLIDCKLKR